MPEHNSTVASPVTFEWVTCTDVNATGVHIDLEDLVTEQDIFSENLAKTETTHGPVGLVPGSYEFDVDFTNLYDSVNDDGIAILVGKYAERDHRFIVGMPLTVIATPDTASTIVLDEEGEALLSVVAENGIQDYSYAWALDGTLVAGEGAAQYIYYPDYATVNHITHGTSRLLTLSCTVTDAAGGRASETVSWSIRVEDSDQEPVGLDIEISPTSPTTVDSLSTAARISPVKPYSVTGLLPPFSIVSHFDNSGMPSYIS